MSKKPIASGAAAAKQLAGFINKYPSPMAQNIRAVRKKIRARLKGANEFVYAGRVLVIGYCPRLKPGEVIMSFAAYERWINLYFFEGGTLPDPDGILKGSGNVVRHIRLEKPDDFDRPVVQAIIDAAVEMAASPPDPANKPEVHIRAVSERFRI